MTIGQLAAWAFEIITTLELKWRDVSIINQLIADSCEIFL